MELTVFQNLLSDVKLEIVKHLDFTSAKRFFLCCKSTFILIENLRCWKYIYNYNYNFICQDCLKSNENLLSDSNKPSDLTTYQWLCIEGERIDNYWYKNLFYFKKRFTIDIDCDEIKPSIRFKDHNSLAFVGKHQTIKFLRVQEDISCREYITTHKCSIICMIMTKFGLICSSVDGVISITTFIAKNCLSDRSQTLHTHHAAVHSLSVDNDILLTGSDDCSSAMIDLNLRRLVRVIHYTNQVRCTSINSNYIAIGGVNGLVKILNRKTNELKEFYPHRLSLVNIEINDHVLATVSRDNTIKIWDLDKLEEKLNVSVKIDNVIIVDNIRFLNNSFILISDLSSKIYFICLINYHIIHEFSDKSCPFNSFELIGNFMITVNHKLEVTIWDIMRKLKINNIKSSSNEDNCLKDIKIIVTENRFAILEIYNKKIRKTKNICHIFYL